MKSKNENILEESVQWVKSVGPKRAESFKKIGVETIRDLLFYFPTRHLDRTNILNAIQAYKHLMNGYDGEMTIMARVEDKEKIRYGRKELLKVHFRDKTGFFECVWFQGVKYFYSVFNPGDIFAVSGKPSESKYGNMQFTHPDFDRITEDESNSLLHTGKIIPFYRIPKELKEKNIGDLGLRRIIHNAVETYVDKIEETLPDILKEKENLMDISEAVKNFHYPESKEKYETALRRFKFEELFYLEVLIALRKKNYKVNFKGNSLPVKTDLIKNFLKTLPFNLTKAQLKVLHEIRKDMESEKPMNRLLQGDVGSGKTIVSLIAMLIAVDNGYQSSIMAPTEILADQHAKNITNLLKPLKEKFGVEVKVSLLLGGQKKSEREKNLEAIELQEADIIVGTHALFEEKVKFNNLGMVVIDEQHRFGVAQRGKLQAKAKTPDIIVMSATPIPRTITMTLYGDLDVSVINEMPKNRKPIKTKLVGDEKLPDVYKFIKEKIKDNYQSFIVYPLVEDSEKLELKAAQTYFDELKQSYFKDVKLGLIHGRMKWREKETIMFQFLTKEFDVLIATTVIEVGIDIPDANIILINDAHRFGLSQLHQLRGRVGRSNKQAFCILVTRDEIVRAKEKFNRDIEYLSSSQLEKYKSSIRLNTMEKYNDGFKVAEVDLKLRGPGDIFGTKQSGFPDLKFVDITQDHELIALAKKLAFNLINKDPHLKSSPAKIIKENLVKHYSSNLNYAKIA